MELQKVQRTTLTMKEAAEYLGISYWLINQLVRRKQIPCSKVGGKFLFRVQALEELYTIIQNRNENRLPIIITTRFDKHGLIERFNQSQDE